MAENFPSLRKETDVQVQEAQKILKKINPNRPTPRHTIIKMEKAKERILKVAKRKREGHITKESSKGYQLIFLQKLRRPERSGMIYSQFQKGNIQPRLLFSARLSFRIEGDIKSFWISKN